MGNQAMMSLAPNTYKRSKRRSVKLEQERIVSRIMHTFDASHTGSLNHEEVKEMCVALAGDVAPNIPITDDDVDMVMRVGGETVKPEITSKDVPAALSAVLALKSENLYLHDLFIKYDRDQSGYLARHQLSEFITEINDGYIPCSIDLDYILEQCDLSDEHGGIQEKEIKAAATAWYCLMDETPLPETAAEAKAMGYTQEQIDFFLEQKKIELEATIGTKEHHEFKEGQDLGWDSNGSFKQRPSFTEAKSGESKTTIAAEEVSQVQRESKNTDLGWDESGRLQAK